MWEKYRIACISYHKFPGDSWPQEWFETRDVSMPNGERVTMKLAEMGSWIGDAKKGLWVREVRKLTASGHQTSLISTAYKISLWLGHPLGTAGCYTDIQPLVPGKLFRLYDATLWH